MSSVYVIAQILIHNREEYDKYDAGFFEVWEKYEGELLSVDENPRILEGAFEATRSVLLRFPSRRAAIAWMTSPEYVELTKHRHAGAITNSIMVEGGIHKPD